MLAFFLAQSAQPSSIGPIALLITVIVVITVGFLYRSAQDRKGSPVAADTAAPAAAQAPGKTVTAPGSFGEIQLYNVDDKSAAMLMAIVADELKTPLNQLRFTSIRQLKEGK